MKRCTKCGIEKPEEAFALQPSRGRRRSECRECKAKADREWAMKRKANPPKSKQHMKQCTHCQEVKPVSEFSPRGMGYFHGECKQCIRETKRAKRQEHYRNDPTARFHRPFENENGVIVKRCTCCHVEKPLSEFYISSKRRNKINYHGKCKECEKVLQKERYDADPEKYRQAVLKSARKYPDRVRARMRRWESAHRERRTHYQRDRRAAEPERFLAYYQLRKSRLTYEDHHRWYMNSREAILERRKGNKHVQEYNRLWRKKNPEKLVAKEHRRRARKKAIAGTHTAAQIQEQLRRQHFRCYYARCGFSKFPRIKENGQWKYIYHVEHTFPLSRVAGSNIPANDMGYIVLSCRTCNESKGSKFPWEWPEGGRLL